MEQLKNTYIYTEVINCGKIGKICLESLLKHNPNVVINVYGTNKDFECLPKNDNIRLHEVTPDIVAGFKQGHLGTAMVWAKAIKERSEKYLIHFDSDVIFRDECFSNLFNALTKGYDIVGAIRNYKHNPNNRPDVTHLEDLAQTYFFAFNREKISDFDLPTLTKMCRGTFNPLGHPFIDFFDPVMFDILKNGGKVMHLDRDEFGGCTYHGKRENKFGEPNTFMDFGSKMAHFSAVGSGMNFAESGGHAFVGYEQYAVERYALYCALFYKEDIGIPIPPKYDCLFKIENWY
jgi:hypothetical protein